MHKMYVLVQSLYTRTKKNARDKKMFLTTIEDRRDETITKKEGESASHRRLSFS